MAIEIKPLSTLYKERNLVSTLYAYCYNCKSYFLDDMPFVGVTLLCPTCPESWAIYRGIKDIDNHKQHLASVKIEESK